MVSWTREQTSKFIQRYKEHECLWKTKSEDYCNRLARNHAYNNLIEYVKSFDKNVCQDDIIKKMNNLRCSFRKEYNKVQRGKVTGTGTQDIYTPRLWYYGELLFLKDQDIPRSAVPNIVSSLPASIDYNDATFEDSTPNSDAETENTESSEIGSPQSPSPIIDQPTQSPSSIIKLPTQSPSSIIYQPTQSPSSIIHQPTQEVKKNTRKRKGLDDELLNACHTCVFKNTSTNTDRHDIFGQHVACTIRQMSEQQQIYAQKIISDVLFEGCLGNLSRACHNFDSGLNPSGTTAYR